MHWDLTILSFMWALGKILGPDEGNMKLSNLWCRRLLLLGMLPCGWLAGAFTLPAHAGLTTDLQLEHGGRTRIYDLYVPDASPLDSLPLLLDLHGYTSNRQQQRRFFGWDQIAEAEGFIVAFPEGFGGQWGTFADDIGFLRALVSELTLSHDIDPDRIYVAGFSQGGSMALRLACEASDVFAAYASLAGPLEVNTQAQCDGVLNAPVIMFMARNDDIVPYFGGTVNVDTPVTVGSATENFDHWRGRNGCTGPVNRTSIGSVSYCDTDTSCEDGAEVRLCTIQGSHPQSTHLVHQNVDNIPLAQRSWDFVSRFEHIEPTPGFMVNSGLSDAWYNPAMPGQGFLISVLPGIRQMFVAWFTYDTERPPADAGAILGEPGHRWLTAQGPYEGDTANLTVFVTEGGVFNAAEPPAETDPEGDGTLTIEFADCNAAMVSYEITSLGISGEIPIERIVLDRGAICEALAIP